MNIIVINGSPKGKYSVSYQYAKYLEALYKNNHTFEVHHIGQNIHKIERDNELFNKIINDIEKADLILWVYPVYTSIVPYQLMRFIELLYERNLQSIFAKKYTSQIVTSRHFYDHTAYNYIRHVCEDFKLNIIQGHLADMEDLKTEIGRKRLCDFMKELEFNISKNFCSQPKYLPVKPIDNIYNPQDIKKAEHTTNYKITIITDYTEKDSNIYRMIKTFIDFTPNPVSVLNLNELEVKSGCLGCLYCTIEGECFIKDEHKQAYEDYVINSDCIIYAGEINHHWLNSIWKKFDDRQFSNGHRISSMGKPVGYLISGPLSQEPNMREIFESRSEVGNLFLLDIVSDEYSSDIITKQLEALSTKALWAIKNKPERPVNFLGVGGMKVFRDLIYTMRGMMKEDHKFYKQHNLYDFPHCKRGTILQSYFIGGLMRFKNVRKKVLPKLKVEMIKDYEKIIEEAKPL